MNLTSIIEYLLANWLENLGILTTLICVWMNTKQNIWGWFWGIICCSIYAYIFWQANLYSDMELQGVYVALSAYGWYQWKFGGKQETYLPVSNTPRMQWYIAVSLGAVFALVSGYLHQNLTDASLPYADATLTGISLVAQWMMARKYIENWILWIIANVGYIMLYMQKSLYSTSFLYVLLLLLAVKGYVDWKKTVRT